MNLHRFFVIIIFFFSFNFAANAEHHENNVIVEDAIIVESDFDLNEAYESKDYSDVDPIEGFNREVWDFNLGLDKVLVRPATRGYVNVMPDPFRRGLGNAIDNFFKTPQYFINNLLQGKVGAAFGTISRLAINSTVGLGGFIDVASKMGIQKRPENFGDTLGTWGWKKSSYVQIPFKGPQTSRDIVGFIGDIFTDPLIFIGVPLWGNLVKTAGTAVDDRQESLGVLEEIEKTSLDFYSSIRSMYMQKRTDEIENDKIIDYQSYLK
jgi:phospholipid-binding lipoprotein MlaA